MGSPPVIMANIAPVGQIIQVKRMAISTRITITTLMGQDILMDMIHNNTSNNSNSSSNSRTTGTMAKV
jgi:hypothetical protein